MKISVVIPVYNGKEFLALCLESLFNQDFPENDYEVIVVDDGSTDSTGKFVKKIRRQHKNLRYLKQENKGVYAARNKGIKRSRYSIIASTDQDCQLSKDWLKTIDLFYKNNPKASACGNFYDHIFYRGRIPTKSMFPQLTRHFERLNRKGKIRLLDRSSIDSFPGTGNLAIKKDVFYSIGFFDESLDICGDIDFEYRLIKSGRLLYINPYLTIYHYTTSNLKKIFLRYYQYAKDQALYLRKRHKKKLIIYVPFFNKEFVSGFVFACCLRLDILKLLVLSLFFGVPYFLSVFALLFLTSFYRIREVRSSLFNLFYNLAIESGYLAGHVVGGFKNKVIYV